MVADLDPAEELRARADIDVTSERWQARLAAATANSHLLEDQAIRTNDSGIVNYNTIWMRENKPATELRVERDVSAGNDTPETMFQHPILGNQTERET